MKTPSCKAVFLDAGHTLIYAYPSLGEVYAGITSQFGLTIAPEIFYRHFTDSFQDQIAGIVSRPEAATSSDREDYDMWRAITGNVYGKIAELRGIDFEDWFHRLYDTFGKTESWRLYPEVPQVLAELKRAGLKMGIVSNWDTRLRNIVNGLGLAEWMDFILISAEVGYRKPNPIIFEQALQQAGVRASEAIHVGDSYEEDAVGAMRSGLRAVVVDRRKKYSHLDGVTVIPDLKSLAALVA